MVSISKLTHQVEAHSARSERIDDGEMQCTMKYILIHIKRSKCFNYDADSNQGFEIHCNLNVYW